MTNTEAQTEVQTKPKRKKKEPIVHLDRLDVELKIGQIVVYACGKRDIDIGRVIRLGEKMITMEKIGKPGWRGIPETYTRYPNELVVLESGETFLYVLRNGEK